MGYLCCFRFIGYLQISIRKQIKRYTSRHVRVFSSCDEFLAIKVRRAKFEFGTARCSYASTFLVILVLSVRLFVCLSVCLSVTRVHCGEKKEHTVDILTLYESAAILIFLYLHGLVGDVSAEMCP